MPKYNYRRPRVGEAAGGRVTCSCLVVDAEHLRSGAVDQVSYDCCQEHMVSLVIRKYLLQVLREDLLRGTHEESPRRSHDHDSLLGVSAGCSPTPVTVGMLLPVGSPQCRHDRGSDGGWCELPVLLVDGDAGVLDSAGELLWRHHVTERLSPAVDYKGVVAVPRARDSGALHVSSGGRLGQGG